MKIGAAPEHSGAARCPGGQATGTGRTWHPLGASPGIGHVITAIARTAGPAGTVLKAITVGKWPAAIAIAP